MLVFLCALIHHSQEWRMGFTPAVIIIQIIRCGGSKPPPYNKGYGNRIPSNDLNFLHHSHKSPQKQKSRPNPNDFIQLSKGWRAGHKARKPSETIFAPPFSTTHRLLSDKRPLLPISLYYPVSDPLIRSHPARSVSAIPPKTLYLVCVSFREGRNHLKRRSVLPSRAHPTSLATHHPDLSQ